MIKIRIQGIEDGEHTIHEAYPAVEIKGMFPEFTGEVVIDGKLRKFGKRFAFTGTAKSTGKLVCDRSLKEFNKDIEADIKVSYMADNTLYAMIESGEIDPDAQNEIIIPEDQNFIELDEEVSEQLAVSIPMKRLAPEYEDLEIEDIYPEHTHEDEPEEDEKEIDSRWENLKKLKFN
ncbi:MAG: YceD family protein [Candidatus Kapaibacterium sp.]